MKLLIFIFSLSLIACSCSVKQEKTAPKAIIELHELSVRADLQDSIMCAIKEYLEEYYVYDDHMYDKYSQKKPSVYYIFMERKNNFIFFDPSNHIFKDYHFYADSAKLKNIGYFSRDGYLLLFVGDNYPELIRVNNKTKKFETTYDNSVDYYSRRYEEDEEFIYGGSPHGKVFEIKDGKIETLFGFAVE